MDKRYVPPIVVSCLIIIYSAVYFIMIISLIPFLWMKIFFAIIPVLFSVVLVFVLIQRINEIKRGEENDLGEY